MRFVIKLPNMLYFKSLVGMDKCNYSRCDSPNINRSYTLNKLRGTLHTYFGPFRKERDVFLGRHYSVLYNKEAPVSSMQMREMI